MKHFSNSLSNSYNLVQVSVFLIRISKIYCINVSKKIIAILKTSPISERFYNVTFFTLLQINWNSLSNLSLQNNWYFISSIDVLSNKIMYLAYFREVRYLFPQTWAVPFFIHLLHRFIYKKLTNIFDKTDKSIRHLRNR